MKKIYKTPNTKVVMAMINTNILAGSEIVDPTKDTSIQLTKGFYPDFEEEEEMDGYGW